MNGKDILRKLLPTGALVTLIYDDSEPEPITGHKITKLNGPQVRLRTRWYYLYQLRGGRELLAQWRQSVAACDCDCHITGAPALVCSSCAPNHK